MNDRATLGPIAISISAMALFVAVADLGTAVVLVLTTFIVIFVAGVDVRYLAVCAGLGILLVIAFVAMRPYRLSRVIDFVDKDHSILNKIDPRGHILTYAHKTASTSDPGYQQMQARIALGSGGFFGAGLMESKQKMLLSSGSAHRFHLRCGRRRNRLPRRRRFARPALSSSCGAACASPCAPMITSDATSPSASPSASCCKRSST